MNVAGQRSITAIKPLWAGLWRTFRQERSALRRSYNWPAFFLITCCGRRIPNELFDYDCLPMISTRQQDFTSGKDDLMRLCGRKIIKVRYQSYTTIIGSFPPRPEEGWRFFGAQRRRMIGIVIRGKLKPNLIRGLNYSFVIRKLKIIMVGRHQPMNLLRQIAQPYSLWYINHALI